MLKRVLTISCMVLLVCSAVNAVPMSVESIGIEIVPVTGLTGDFNVGTGIQHLDGISVTANFILSNVPTGVSNVLTFSDCDVSLNFDIAARSGQGTCRSVGSG